MRVFKFLIVLLCLTTLCVKGLYAQQTEQLTLSINEMFLLADSNNLSIKVYSTAIEQSLETVKVAKNAYLPSIAASLNLNYNGDGVITSRDFSDSFTTDIPDFGNNFSIEVSQVIFAGGVIRNGVKISELQSQLSILDAEGNRQDVRLLLVNNYLELCELQNQLQVFERNINLTRKVLENMRLRYNEGAALQNDITRYELQLQSLEYSNMQLRNSMLILNNSLISALGLPKFAVINPVLDEQFLFMPANGVNNDYWIDTASSSSIVVRNAAIGVKISEYAEKIAYADKYPQVALFAADVLNGPVTIEIPALDNNFNYWYAGVGVSYNLDNLYKSGKLVRLRQLAVKHANEQLAVAVEQVQLSIDAAVIRYNEAFKLLETRQKSSSLANQNYDVINYRYENGLALITELLDASSQKLDAELQVIDAQINIVANYYKLKYVSGTL